MPINPHQKEPKLEDIIPLLEKADVVVLPSYYREGIPHCLIEALAASKPIITTNTIGCREVINENGILIPPKDSKALLKAMLEMLNSNKLKYWSENSFKQASKFDLNLKLWKESIFFLKNQRIFNFGKDLFHGD